MAIALHCTGNTSNMIKVRCSSWSNISSKVCKAYNMFNQGGLSCITLLSSAHNMRILRVIATNRTALMLLTSCSMLYMHHVIMHTATA